MSTLLRCGPYPFNPRGSPSAPGLILKLEGYHPPSLCIQGEVEAGTTMGTGHFWALSDRGARPHQ